MLTPAQCQELKQRLLETAAQLEALSGATRDAAAPVSLEQPIGRLARMDSLQNQQLADAQRRQREQQKAQIQSALRRLEEDTYGECISCGEDIGYDRLKVRPETPLCLGCQRSRER